MIKVGIIGCGKIADQHASAIQSIDDCEIVGVCDKEELMAIQIADRFKIKKYFAQQRLSRMRMLPQASANKRTPEQRQ